MTFTMDEEKDKNTQSGTRDQVSHDQTSDGQSDQDDQRAHRACCGKCDEYLAGWKRAQADYQNLKKETEREKAEFAKYANERLLHELLPAIDQFGIAMQHVPSNDAEPKTWLNWAQGVRAIQSLWEQMAKAVGLERIPAQGSFDPLLHDAVGEEEKEGQEPGTIVRVATDGWRLHGKVLRPAKVIISK